MAFTSATLLQPRPVERPPPSRDADVRAGPRFEVQVVAGRDLANHRAAWEQLIAVAAEPNCFYEPWMLLPAIEHFGREVRLEIVLVFRTEAGQPRQMCGLFPCERRTRLHGLPVHLLKLCQHLHCFLGTPLVHRDYGRDTLHALFDWARSTRDGAALLELPMTASDGPFAQALVDVIRERQLLTFNVEQFNRAVLRPCADAQAYVQTALGSKHRRELQRMRRRLGDLGRLESRVLEPGDDAAQWIEQFLQLEASGWKGTQQTALNCAAGERAYFSAITYAAHARGQLMMLGLFLDDRPLALKCNFRAGRGAFCFKIAFDESYDKYSPGVQLELDNIALAHQMPGLAWMDSCAKVDHPMINRLWTERRMLQHVLVATGGWRGKWIVSLLPLLRALKRTCRGRR